LTEPQTLDSLLAELDTTIRTLADGSAPLEELVAAHQRAVDLLARAQESFAKLKERGDQITRLLA
jgi:exodeoxyribonuclease VII small subunit